MEVIFKRFVGNIKIISGSKIISTRGCEIFIHLFSIYLMPTLPATEEKAQGSHTFAARWQIDQGDCFVGSRLVSQTSITTVCKNKGLDRVVNISIDSQGVPF